MRIVQFLCLAGASVAMLSARPADAQDASGSREVTLHFHKVGDTLSIKNAAVEIDHSIEAGKTDAAGNVRVVLDDGGHIAEATAAGYIFMFDNFNSGPAVPQPVEFEMIPTTKPDATGGKPPAPAKPK